MLENVWIFSQMLKFCNSNVNVHAASFCFGYFISKYFGSTSTLLIHSFVLKYLSNLDLWRTHLKTESKETGSFTSIKEVRKGSKAVWFCLWYFSSGSFRHVFNQPANEGNRRLKTLYCLFVDAVDESCLKLWQLNMNIKRLKFLSNNIDNKSKCRDILRLPSCQSKLSFSHSHKTEVIDWVTLLGGVDQTPTWGVNCFSTWLRCELPRLEMNCAVALTVTRIVPGGGTNCVRSNPPLGCSRIVRLGHVMTVDASLQQNERPFINAQPITQSLCASTERFDTAYRWETFAGLPACITTPQLKVHM